MSKLKLTACIAAIAFALSATTSPSLAEQSEIDPGSVSKDLMALFSAGSDSQKPKERLNANTIALSTRTHEAIAADLESVLHDVDNLRILPIVGRGPIQSIADILFLNEVDLGVTRSDSLEYLEMKGYADSLKSTLTYITKLFHEEMHVVAPKVVEKLADLEGKRVSVSNGGAFITASAVFERLGIKPKFVYLKERLAYEKLQTGEIDAMVAIQASPSKFMTEIKNDRLHFVPVEYAAPLQTDYLPAQLTAKDYPALIRSGERVDTIAVTAILAARNWDPGTERYRKTARFVRAFFSRFKELQKPPFYPKWKEVVLSAPLKGWKRFPAAQEWLDDHSKGMMSETQRQFNQFLATRASSSEKPPTAMLEQSTALYRQFLEWQKETTAKPLPRKSRTTHRHKRSRIKTKHRNMAKTQTNAKNRIEGEQAPQEAIPAQSAAHIYPFPP
jgi:TRAP-type uncharacterized transport system substrate-binding protein